MRTLSLPLALTARISPVVVLAAAGWALTSGPATTPAAEKESAPRSAAGETPSGASTAAASKQYAAAPAPCGSITAATIKSLVPGAKTAGKEIPSTDTALRRTCSWNALKGYDYRWLDVSFEITESDAAAAKSYKENIAEKSGGGTVPGVGDAGYSVVNLTTENKQQTREGVVMIQASNALVTVTYNGSDFESKKAPSTDEINKGAIKAAKEAVAALESGQKA
ncbi:hypothetical protein ABZT02_28910 [Streptomyces sp. NPDC005402]|uniref:hypothetical protein n=1 Tax=Streptomyces sp. NPDC005402 TaxID=3155338 RepID=UPI0033AF772B